MRKAGLRGYLKTSSGETPCLERKKKQKEERRLKEREAIMTTACSYSQRMKHLSSLESMIYFSTSRKGYVCHRAVKGLLEIATKS